MVRRGALGLVPVLAMIVAAWLVLRAPDAAQTWAFFSAGIPSMAAAEAAMTMLAWLVVSVAACLALVVTGQRLSRSRTGRKSPSVASVFLAVGLMLLAVAAVRHAVPGESFCCGSGPANVREAIQLAR
jgi:predicted permease